MLEVDIFTVFSPDVGYGFVVEGFAEAVGVVAIVRGEGIGESITFGFEHDALTVVVTCKTFLNAASITTHEDKMGRICGVLLTPLEFGQQCCPNSQSLW